MRSPTELTELFRDRGLKVTPQRQCIFRALHGSGMHPTAETVHARVVEEMPTVSLRTVYQTLKELVDMGEIHQLDLGTGSSRFDPNVGAHHHLVCSRCGKVRDLEVAFPAVEVPAGADLGYEISAVEIVFRGRCPDCAAGVATTEVVPAGRDRSSSETANPGTADPETANPETGDPGTGDPRTAKEEHHHA